MYLEEKKTIDFFLANLHLLTRKVLKVCKFMKQKNPDACIFH